MPRLHEIIAVTTGKKGEVEKAVTEAYHVLQKGDLFDGLTRTYRPAEEGGERLPSESKRIQKNVTDVIADTRARWTDLLDATLTMDAGNQSAQADIVVGGKLLATAVPVTTLLFLEKQVTNFKAFIEKIPTPDPTEQWVYDAATGNLATLPVETSRTKKINRPIVLFPATPEHPAQTQMVTEDVLAGYWATMKTTTRLPTPLKTEMLARAGALLDAIKVAREQANAIEVSRRTIAASLLGFVFDTPK